MNYTRLPEQKRRFAGAGAGAAEQFGTRFVCTGLSATVAEPDALRYLAPQTGPDSLASLVVGAEGQPQVDILDTKERLPWGSHSALHAMSDVLAAVEKVKTALIFVLHARRPSACFVNYGRSITTIWKSPCITGRWRASAPPRWRRPWRRVPCARWCAPPPLIWALTGAVLIWSSMSVRPKGQPTGPTHRARQSPI